MLKLKNIYKYYKNGKEKRVILDNITLDFKKGELVFILGASGSGKTTLLSIISGNLKCDSGEVWYGSNCITQLNDRQLNYYRGSVVGNIFQDYNLIEDISVIGNIMLGYNKGISKGEINLLLKQLGIYEKKYNPVNKLSGGEKQRVAIARALVGNPDIILADEPTGALDSASGLAVMDILKRIAKNKLVIVVSHDTALANKYASRIIRIKDGKCDYYPLVNEVNIERTIKKKRIRFGAILKLALNNLWIKKGRTIFTSLAISLGIVSMFLVINLYNNFSIELKKLESDIVSVYPITISNGEYTLMDNDMNSTGDKIIIRDNDKLVHTNNINKEYLKYIDGIAIIKDKNYIYDISMPLVSDNYKIIDNNYFYPIPSSEYIYDNYDIIYGNNITNKYDILLKVDHNNNVDSKLLNYFGIDSDIDYESIIGRKIKVVLNDLYYFRNVNYYVIESDNHKLYDNSNIELRIVGIIREKERISDNNYLYYDNSLIDLILENNKNSEIVKKQLISNYNILGINMDKDDMLSYLGYVSMPIKIDLYVDSLNDKKGLMNLLDEYNREHDDLIYSDIMQDSIEIVKEFIMIITVILVMFSFIAIFIATLMVGILTNVRILERKRDIGIFRSLGASKNNIKKLFNIENLGLGLIALVISLIIINVIKAPINSVIKKYLEIDNIFTIRYHIILLVYIINIIIIRIASYIPIRKASRLEIVDCIYNRG